MNGSGCLQRTVVARAIVSAAVVTRKRVTVFGSAAWGFDIDSTGTVRHAGPRAAVGEELRGHLALLGKGTGTSGRFLAKAGRFALRQRSRGRMRYVRCFVLLVSCQSNPPTAQRNVATTPNQQNARSEGEHMNQNADIDPQRAAQVARPARSLARATAPAT